MYVAQRGKGTIEGQTNITIKDLCPLPLMSETLDQLGGAVWFAKLDFEEYI